MKPLLSFERLATLSRAAILLVATLTLVSPTVALAADDAVPGRVPTVTRLVKLFLELEAALNSSLQGGNSLAAEKMLMEDFELRVGSMPGNPTPRAEWIRQSLDHPAPSFRIEQMAVHDVGDIAVVSFLQAGRTGSTRDPARDIFTIDVWKRAGEGWKLAIRYAGPAGSRDFVIPGASNTPLIDKRY